MSLRYPTPALFKQIYVLQLGLHSYRKIIVKMATGLLYVSAFYEAVGVKDAAQIKVNFLFLGYAAFHLKRRIQRQIHAVSALNKIVLVWDSSGHSRMVSYDCF